MPPIRVPSAHGGKSTQDKTLRFQNQVADASNRIFDPKFGSAKRPGTHTLFEFTLVAGNPHSMFSINRDEVEKYKLILGKGATNTIARVFQIGGVEATVNISAAAQAYLDYNDAVDTNKLRVRSVSDNTFIINRLRPTASASEAVDFDVTEQYQTYEIMTGYAPTAETYHQTLRDSSAQFGDSPAGFFQYIIDDGEYGFARWLRDPDGTTEIGNDYKSPFDKWDSPGRNPIGFSIRFRRSTDGTAAGTWVQAAKTISIAAGFTNYTKETGDEWYNPDATTLPIGFYPVLTRDTAGQITLDATKDARDANNTIILAATWSAIVDGAVDGTGGGITRLYDWSYDLSLNTDAYPKQTLGDMAVLVQQELRKSVSNDPINDVAVNHVRNTVEAQFEIICPWRGTGATVVGIYESTTSGTSDQLVNSSKKPFRFASGTVTVGTGSPTETTFDIEERWNRVAAPGDATAVIDKNKMPITLRRITSGYDDGAGGFTAAVFDLDTIDWSPRKDGSELTNPTPQIIAKGHVIEDFLIFQNRSWMLGGPFAESSQNDDLFDFFKAQADEVVDSDPIRRTLSDSDGIAIGQHLVEAGGDRGLIVWTKTNSQFDITAENEFTPGTTVIKRRTRYDTEDIEPISMGPVHFFISRALGSVDLWSYFWDEVRQRSIADPLTEHYEDQIPFPIKRLTASTNNGIAFVLPDAIDNTDIHTVVPRYRSGNIKPESLGWCPWTIGGLTRIVDITSVEDHLYVLGEVGGGLYTIEQIAARPEDCEGAFAPTLMPTPKINGYHMILCVLDNDFFSLNVSEGPPSNATYTARIVAALKLVIDNLRISTSDDLYVPVTVVLMRNDLVVANSATTQSYAQANTNVDTHAAASTYSGSAKWNQAADSLSSFGDSNISSVGEEQIIVLPVWDYVTQSSTNWNNTKQDTTATNYLDGNQKLYVFSLDIAILRAQWITLFSDVCHGSTHGWLCINGGFMDYIETGGSAQPAEMDAATSRIPIPS